MSVKKAFLFLVAAVYLTVLVAVVYGSIVGLRQFAGWRQAGPEPTRGTDARKPAAALKKKSDALAPKGLYIVVDTGANRFYLKKGTETVRQGLVSTGSGDILPEPKGERQWVFDTPRGEFAVKSKVENPYWVKPDWAFIEEGEPIPKNADDRVVGGELGDYALGFGSGYFLHGTLYTRLLGRNVTHGCVRIGDEDLKFLFKSASIGTKIYIY
ncbi:MAG TPA: L,D-transpeptidase [Acidobacteriota bacterium]|nr:L,D-transpeptidase [Acidobacteriota bacterium]